jgi:hypothetical protein
MRYLRHFTAFLLLASASLLARNPVPLLYQLSPTSIRPGHAAFTIQVRGTGFVAGATVRWNGQPLTTTFVSSSLLQAAVPANDVSTRGTASVTVANQGTIASNVIYFPVRVPSPTVTLEADPTGIEQGYVTVADFNNDSVPDVLVYGTFYYDTYLGTGKGGFTRVEGPREFGYLAWACAQNPPADFNNDGKMDIAFCSATNSGSASQVFGGDGAGHFVPGSTAFAEGAGVAADMNGDGNLDFVTISYDGQSQPELDIYLGNGKSTFTLAGSVPYFGGLTPVVGDFNSDGKLDVALIGPHVVSVFLGNGDGTLGPQVDYPITGDSYRGATSAIVADVNGDGNLDIVTNGVGVLLGAGDGTFTNTFSIPLSSNDPTGNLSVGDINGDGTLDLATAGAGSSYQESLYMLLGNGDGTFQSPVAYDLPPESFELSLGMADFDNNGKLDFVFGGSPSTLFMFQK